MKIPGAFEFENPLAKICPVLYIAAFILREK